MHDLSRVCSRVFRPIPPRLKALSFKEIKAESTTHDPAATSIFAFIYELKNLGTVGPAHFSKEGKSHVLIHCWSYKVTGGWIGAAFQSQLVGWLIYVKVLVTGKKKIQEALEAITTHDEVMMESFRSDAVEATDETGASSPFRSEILPRR